MPTVTEYRTVVQLCKMINSWSLVFQMVFHYVFVCILMYYFLTVQMSMKTIHRIVDRQNL